MSLVKLAATAPAASAEQERRRREAAAKRRRIQYTLAGLGTAAALYGAAKGLKDLREAHLMRARLENVRTSLPRGMSQESGFLSRMIHRGRMRVSKKYRERAIKLHKYLKEMPRAIEEKRFSGLLHGGLAVGGAALASRYAPAAPSEDEL